MNELKKQLVAEALKTTEPEETLEMLYIQNKLAPQQHKNPLTNIEFHGKNIWTLEIKMITNSYNSANWSTFAQYKEANNFVDKGQVGTKLTLAVFGKGKDDKGEEKQELKYFKGYTVFNYEQTKEYLKPEEMKQIQEVKQLEMAV